MALAAMEEDDLPTLQMTAQAIVRADNGNRMKIRVLIDTGATSSLLATRVATRLGFAKDKDNHYTERSTRMSTETKSYENIL